MKLTNIVPGKADVTAASITYGHVEHRAFGWRPFDKEGKPIGSDIYGLATRSQAAEAVLRHYREIAARH